MDCSDIVKHRLVNQQIVSTDCKAPGEIVSLLIAMQAQEYAQAKWSIGLRLPGINGEQVEAAFNRGEILRTHLLRPTWHFVTPGDIRWLLMLTAPRVHSLNAYWYKKSGLDAALFKRCNDIFTSLLEGGNTLTRDMLNEALKNHKIEASGLRLSYIMMQAELEGLICSGPRQGNQFTYALLEERVPVHKPCGYQECLANFARRYFSSRGPATLHDFVYWSGLSMKEARLGASLLPPEFEKVKLDDQEYFFIPKELQKLPSSIFLRPDYDEYGLCYKNREAFKAVDRVAGGAYKHNLLIDGKEAGSWQYEMKGNTVKVAWDFYQQQSKARQQQVLKAVKRFADFSGKELLT